MGGLGSLGVSIQLDLHWDKQLTNSESAVSVTLWVAVTVAVAVIVTSSVMTLVLVNSTVSVLS